MSFRDLVFKGGDLESTTILAAYRLGFFPWPNPDVSLRWFHPAERCVLFPHHLYCARRERRTVRQRSLSCSIDRCFEEVIGACATVDGRERPEKCWITPEMRAAYCNLHRRGYAHSFEVYSGGTLCGGLYGISLGAAFFGESMFSTLPGSSKIALASLVGFAVKHRFLFIDCQLESDHLRSLGATTLVRPRFMELLAQSNARPTLRGDWNHAPTVYQKSGGAGSYYEPAQVPNTR